ncbi:hypothetical protein AAE478_002936 [Parahypoxylon ruwenzoriense]
MSNSISSFVDDITTSSSKMVQKGVGYPKVILHFEKEVILEEMVEKVTPLVARDQNVGDLMTGRRWWWFSTSNHDVKIVIVAKFDHRQREIILEKWEEAPPDRLGATTTRRTPTLQPVLRQEIAINRDQRTDPISYNVTRGPLVLGFKLLFLRDPCPQEGDYVISIPELQWYAECV